MLEYVFNGNIVSEGLNSVETCVPLPQNFLDLSVSEGLNSVETTMRSDAHRLCEIVSEGLNSVETVMPYSIQA